MKVAFVMPGTGVVKRGAEAFVLDLCRALPERGIDVTLFCRDRVDVPHEIIRALPRDTGWLRTVYDATTPTRKVLDTVFLDPLNLEWATASLSALPKLARGAFDVIVMEGGLVGGWIARYLRKRGAAFVDIAHGLSAKWEGAFARNGPDRVVVFTKAFADQLGKLAPGARIEIVPHGVDLSFFHPDASPPDPGRGRSDPQSPIILYVGHIDEHKQTALTVRAVAGLERASLVVLGEGPEQTEVDRLAGELLGPERYRRLGVDRSALPGWYARASCCTLASKTEAFGLVYLEAMACNTPCVAPDDAVRREVIGTAGVLFETDNLSAYTEALAKAVREPWHRRPRDRAETFSFTTTADRYAELLREVAG